MSKLFRKNPAYIILPALIIIIGAVFFLTERQGRAKEWDRIGTPAGFVQGRINDISSYYDAASKSYKLWAVGGAYTYSGSTGIDDGTIMSYDSQTSSWQGVKINDGIEINAVSELVKVSGGSNLIFAAGDGWLLYFDWNNINSHYLIGNGSWPCTPGGCWSSVEGYNLTDINFANSIISTGRAVGYDTNNFKGIIFKNNDNVGLVWSKDSVSGSWPSVPFLAVKMISEGNGWVVGANHTVYKKDSAQWRAGITNTDIPDLSGLTFGTCVNNGDNDYCSGNSAWPCVSGSPDPRDDCEVDFKDIYFTDDGSQGWIPISTKKYLYYNSSVPNPKWRILPTYRPSSEPEYRMNGVTVAIDGASTNVWFSGDNGVTIFSPDNSHWVRQTTPALNAGVINRLTSVDATHVWSVGYQKETATRSDYVTMQLSSGNTSGYAYIGADDCQFSCLDSSGQGGACQANGCDTIPPTDRTAPYGWIGFNCMNNGSCETNTFTYGVDLKRQIDTSDPTKSCITTPNPDTAGFQDKDVGALSGQAWLGGNDPNEKISTACVSGTCAYDSLLNCTTDSDCLLCVSGHCRNNSSLTCATEDKCALCGSNPSSCFTPGWLSFNRKETGTPPAAPYNTVSFATPCNYNNSKIINANTDYEGYAEAFFNYQNYTLKGWGRFKLGQCSETKLACFYDNDNECPGATNVCKFYGPGRCKNSYTTYCKKDADCGASGPCDFATGWLKLRGDSLAGPLPSVSSGANLVYKNCNACTTNDAGTPGLNDDYMTCKICDGLNLNPAQLTYACNDCQGANNCGNGRCSGKPEETCLVVTGASQTDRCEQYDINNPGDPNPWGTCLPSGYCVGGNNYKPCVSNNTCGGGICKLGYCSNDGSPCFDISNCGAGTCEKNNPISCNSCGSCDKYGVSVDIDGGNYYGYGWSEDFGWVDFSRVSLGGKAWLQTLFGDIYGQQGIGTSSTNTSPGAKTAGSTCNATYLILAGNTGQIVNFCSSSYSSIEQRLVPSTGLPQASANPWLVEKYRTFTLPTSNDNNNANNPNSILGRVDYQKMISTCVLEGSNYIRKGTRNSTNELSSWFSLNGDTLNGKVYCVRDDDSVAPTKPGDLTINELGGNFTFINGTSAYPNGSGLIVVDGDLIIQSNLTYQNTSIDSLKKLASVGWYVKGNIFIGAGVTTLVGNFYSEKSIITQSMGAADTQLNVYGVMIAKEFNLGRRYRGTLSNPQPSEIFTYDGRIQLNPPPGFRDLSTALPKFSETTP